VDLLKELSVSGLPWFEACASPGVLVGLVELALLLE
jgi:hypothetical protein